MPLMPLRVLSDSHLIAGSRMLDSKAAKGNNMADQEAKAAARGSPAPMILTTKLPEKEQLKYSEDDLEQIQRKQGTFDANVGAWIDSKGKVILPQKDAKRLIAQMHQWTHLGARKLTKIVLQSPYRILNFTALTEKVTQTCIPCQKVNVEKNFQSSKKTGKGN